MFRSETWEKRLDHEGSDLIRLITEEYWEGVRTLEAEV